MVEEYQSFASDIGLIFAVSTALAFSLVPFLIPFDGKYRWARERYDEAIKRKKALENLEVREGEQQDLFDKIGEDPVKPKYFDFVKWNFVSLLGFRNIPFEEERERNPWFRNYEGSFGVVNLEKRFGQGFLMDLEKIAYFGK